MKNRIYVLVLSLLMSVGLLAQMEDPFQSTSSFGGSGSNYSSQISTVGATDVPSSFTTTDDAGTHSGRTIHKLGPNSGIEDPGTPGESPIGEPLVMLLFAAAAAGVIYFKRKKSTTNMKQIFKFLTFLLLLALSFGFNQEAKADNTHVVGVAASNSNSCTMKLNVNRKGDGDEWQSKEMSKAGLTFEGKKVYITSYEEKYGGLGKMQFQLYSGSTWKEQKEPISSWTSSIHSNEIYNYDDGSWYSKLTMSQSKVYFDATGWSQTAIKLVIGHANYQGYYSMTNLTNTKLYYNNSNYSWSDAMGFGVVGGTSRGDTYSGWLTDVSANASEYTGFRHYELKNNSGGYLVTNKGKAGEKPDVSYYSSYSDLDKKQTISVMLSTNGGSSYSSSSTWYGKINANRTYMSSASATTTATKELDGTADTKKYASGTITSTFEFAENTTNTGYTFVGFSESSSTKPSSNAAKSYTVSEAKTIYAYYRANGYQVKFDGNGATSGSMDNEQYYYGVSKNLTTNAFQRTNYNFVGWNTDKDAKTALYVDKESVSNLSATDGDVVTLYAIWALAKVDVTYGVFGSTHGTIQLGSGTAITGNTTEKVDGASTVTLTATPAANYTVAGWYANSSCTGDILQDGDNTGNAQTYTIPNIAEDRTVYVKFRERDYSITLTKGTGIDAIKVNGTTQSSVTAHVETKTATITADVKTGYTWSKWTTSGPITATPDLNTNGIQINATSTGTLTANATEILHSVSVASNDVNKGTVSTASVSSVGIATKSANITATQKPGYYFTGWDIPEGVTLAQGYTQQDATIQINATADNITITANFAPRFYLRGSENAAGDPKKGMPGWGDDAKESGKGLFTNIDDNTATITRTLEAATEYKLKLGDMTGNSWGGSHEFKSGEDLWTFTSHDQNCEAPTFTTAIAGTYTFTIDFSGTSPKMKITYPTPDFTLQVAKTRVYEESTLTFIDGDGSQDNPYQFYLDEKMHLAITALSTVPGVTAYYKFGDDAESSSVLTKDITATTAKQSIVVKTYYKSTIGSYQSAEKTQTIWYQGVDVPVLHLTASWNEKEESELSDNPEVTIYYSTDHYAGAATVTSSVDGGEPTTFMTITTETQQDQTYQMTNRDPHRYDFAASATVNERELKATTSVSIYRLVEVRVKDTGHLMSKYYMWINGSNPLQEEAAWPGNDFIGKLGDWHIFLVKYPSYTHFVLNNGKNGDEEGAAQTVDVQLPVTNTCYEIGAKGGDNKYAVTVAGACPDKLYVGDIANVTLHQGESQLITPEVDLDFGYNESQLQITFPNLPSGFTAVPQGKNFMLTGANQCAATSITVRYTLDGYSVEKTFSATVTHPSNILIQVAINTSYGWNAKDQIRIMYFNHGLDGEKNMTWHHYANDEDYFYAKIPVGTDGKVDFLVHAWDFEKEHMDHQTTNMENVDMPGCFYVSNNFYEGKRGIARRGDDCWEEYQVVINMANGKTYYSNKVENLNDIVSFYAPGKDETGNKSGLVRILRNGTQVATVSAATFDSSTIYTAKITTNGAGLTDVAYYTGDYYIRTSGAEGGWDNYKKESHKFTYFTPYEGALYDYYWVQNIKQDKLNIKACIANEYNENLADMIESSSYTDGYGDITPDAGTGVNLRFGYNPETNYFERSILRGSTAGSNDFLNIVGNNIFNDNDCQKELNEANYTAHPDWSKFGDISNWVYEKNIYVKIDGSHQYANALLKSKAFNGNIIYQLGYTRDPITGAETSTPAKRDILSIGTTNGTYNIRVIYDFKTNRIVSAWSPVKDITYSDQIRINADVLFVRHEGNKVAQVNLDNDAAKVSSLKSAYFVMEIDGASDKTSESIYWFSVPFDCEISSIFGVEGYVTLDDNGIPTAGTWGIQEYDGKTRAEKGWYIQDTPTFWRWMRKNETLKKGNGYMLIFDRTDANSKGLWKEITREEPCVDGEQGCTDGKKTVTTTVLRLYFPSSQSGWEMTRSDKADWVTYEDWTCTKPNRKAQDSNWRLMGTNSYSNIKIDAETQFERTENDSVLDKAPNFIYEYHPERAQYDKYVAISSLERDFQSFYSYMVQFSGKINWNQYTQSEPEGGYKNVAARRVVAENELTNAQMTLSLKKGNNTEDNTFIYMDARATTDFDNQMDLTKITDTRANQIYSVTNEVEYAGNTLPVEDQIVPLTVNVNANGAYTFTMPNMTDGLEVYLMDNTTNAHIDMAIDSYTVDLNKGKIADRFYLDVRVKERTTPTIIETIGTDGNPTGDRFIKVIQNDQLRIIRNGRIYNASGMELNR